VYRFEPGSVDDGINVEVPTAALAQLSQHQLNWLVPGWLTMAIAELIRCLPKAMRRNLVPVPDTAQRAAAEIAFGRGDLLEVVARQLSKLGQSPVRPADFQLDQLPAQMRMNIRAIDDRNRVVAQGRDLAELRRQFGLANSTSALTQEVAIWNKSGLTQWDFGDLPERVTVRRGGVDVPLYPTLQDDQHSVSLGLAETAEIAKWHSAAGAARLYQIANRKAIKSQVDWLPELQSLATSVSTWVAADSLRETLSALMARIALSADEREVRSRADFERHLANAGARLAAAAQQVSS
jgi:ATP-dependent helicase HrpA